jgi:hypothetical protein
MVCLGRNHIGLFGLHKMVCLVESVQHRGISLYVGTEKGYSFRLKVYTRWFSLIRNKMLSSLLGSVQQMVWLTPRSIFV